MKLDQLLGKAQELLDSGNTQEGIEILKRIFPYFENNPNFLNILGTACLRVNENEEGIKLLKRANSLNPTNTSILFNLGKAFVDLKDFVNAKKYLILVKKLEPENILFLNYLGMVLVQFNKFDEAHNLFLKAAKINPNYFYSHYNIGLLLHKKKDYLNADKSYDKAIAANPSHYQSLWGKALIKLMLGEYKKGWELYEIRLKNEEINREYKLYDASKTWRGDKPIQGKTLLIYGEQGFGDVIQFSRYIPLLASYNSKLILYVKKQLVSLLQTLGTDITVIGMDSSVPNHDFNCPLMSLPLVFKTDLTNIPNKVPYLSASKTKEMFWKKKMGETNNIRVGVVFSGSKTYNYDSSRSIGLEQFKNSLEGINSVEFHSLMVDYKNDDKELIESSDFLTLHDKELNNFSDTAALINSLDLVISVDTAVAHLAGALNKQVWILVPFLPDFRWMEKISHSIWYPSAKIFRQKNKDDWNQPLKKIKLALVDFVKESLL